MKQSMRHKQILELVSEYGYLSTEDLVNILEVSPQTMRRDLKELAENNLIRRHHGGATCISSTLNSDYRDRKSFFSKQKQAIAQEVAKMIPNGASLFIDIGTTPEAVAHALLNHKSLYIVTNNINAAHILMNNETFKITVASGDLRPDGGIIGEATVHFVSKFSLDFAVLGISAIDNDGAMLDFDFHEVQVKRAIIKNAQTIILPVDHSKFSRRAVVRVGALSDVNHLLTNRPPQETIRRFLQEHNVNLHIVE